MKSKSIVSAVAVTAFGLALMMTAGASAEKAEKADICHFDKDTGLFHVISVSENAVSTHLSNHGDSFPGVFYADVDGDGFGDPAGPTDPCPNPGFVNNNSDQCPNVAGPPENNGCLAPKVSLGSDLVIGQAGEFGHTGNMAMLFGDGAGGFRMDKIDINVFDTAREVAVGDVNGDGKDDVVVVESRGQVYVALGPFTDGLQNTDLVPAGSFTEGAGNCCNRVRVLQLGDLNNDGKLDIAVTMWSKMGVMLGNGDGTFGTEIQSPATGFDARGMALGDLDGDGKLDLVANHAPGNWWLAFHRGNGDGTFQQGIVIPNSAFAIPNIFLRDTDGDGDLDIISGSLQSRFKIFLNDGSANFTKTDVDLGSVGFGLIADDLNGDGAPDVITTAPQDMAVRVSLSDGHGGFLAFTDYGPVGSQPRQAVIGDFNGDGKKDVAMVTVNIFVSGQDGGLWTLLGNGDGTFQAPTRPITTYRNNYTIAAGNFD